MFNAIIDAFRPHIEVDGERFLCRLIDLRTALHENDTKNGQWLPATTAHLSAFESKHLRGDRPPPRPVVALGSGTEGENCFADVSFIGIDDRAPGVFPGGLRSHGKTFVWKAQDWRVNYTDALEVKKRN